MLGYGGKREDDLVEKDLNSTSITRRYL